MNNLDDYIIYDESTQYNKDFGYSKNLLYEIYGKTESGIIFERDLKNTDQILLHVGDGIKKAQAYLNIHDDFFRKNNGDSKFFPCYSDYKDFNFYKKEYISKDRIINVIKRFVYMESPKVWSSTLMGGGKGILDDPNWMYGTFALEDNKEYTVIKRYDTVKIFKGQQDMYAFSKEKEYCSYILSEDLYRQALRLNKLRRFIALNSFGKIDVKVMEEFIQIYKKLDEETKITQDN